MGNTFRANKYIMEGVLGWRRVGRREKQRGREGVDAW